jgi:hypothetical protein
VVLGKWLNELKDLVDDEATEELEEAGPLTLAPAGRTKVGVSSGRTLEQSVKP